MHDAFKVSVALDNLPKIDTIFAHGNKLLVGSAGSLMVYQVKDPTGDDPLEVTLIETHKTFSRRSIDQLDIIKESNVLVSLADGSISLFDLKTFELQEQLSRTRGANIFAVDTQIEEEGVVPVIVTRLAVGVRKKLVVFIWRDAVLYNTKEISIPDRVRTMVWVGLNKLCLGFPSEYALLDIESEVLHELFATTSSPTAGAFTSYGIGYMGMSIAGRASKPLITKLPNNEILLAKDNVSIFVETDGKPTRETGIDWSGAPEEIGYSYPYLIAILPKHVEVRNILTQTLVQTIELLHARFINAGKYLYIASHSTVWRFIPYNFEKQIDQLVEQMEYVEAISLTMQIDTIYLQDKEAKLKYIRNLHGHNLFRQHKFEEAISIFIDLEADPKEIVALYPPAISASLRSDSSHNKKLHLNGSANKLTTDGVSEEHDPETVSDSETIIKNDSKLEGKDLEEAIKQLIRFLTDRRAKVHKLLLQRQLSKSTTKENEDHLIELAEFVETSLLKAYMNSNDSLVGSLVRVKNFCNVEETEKLLSERKKYRELVEFYHEKGLYRKSLELLKRLGESTEGPMNGTFQTIQYLQKLGSDHFDLILEFATWVLKADPVDGMEIFIGDHPKVETLPRSKVLDYLEKFSPDLCITYIGHIIHELGDKHPDHHNRLIYAYLKKLQDLKQEGAEPVIVEEANKNFLQFLEESSYYIAEKILGHLPMDDYYEARAILLSRLGQHDQALNIYVHKLKDEQLAEEYCLKIYNEADEKAKNVFLSLLRVYLRPKSGEPVMIEPAIRLLSRHGAHVDASKALDMLPPSIEVAQLYKFVEKYIRESNRNRCINIIVKNLLKADQYQVQEQLLFYRSRRVKIDDDRMCPQCTRRIAHSVFAVFPNGVVVHYHCKDKYSQAHDTAA